MSVESGGRACDQPIRVRGKRTCTTGKRALDLNARVHTKIGTTGVDYISKGDPSITLDQAVTRIHYALKEDPVVRALWEGTLKMAILDTVHPTKRQDPDVVKKADKAVKNYMRLAFDV